MNDKTCKEVFFMDRKRRSGFTLVEILVVVVILGLLATLVIPRVVGRGEEAKRTATLVQIRAIEQALDLYKLDNGFYPTTEQGLEALVSKPSGMPEPMNSRTGWLPCSEKPGSSMTSPSIAQV